jgi:hypothetical protein
VRSAGSPSGALGCHSPVRARTSADCRQAPDGVSIVTEPLTPRTLLPRGAEASCHRGRCCGWCPSAPPLVPSVTFTILRAPVRRAAVLGLPRRSSRAPVPYVTRFLAQRTSVDHAGAGNQAGLVPPSPAAFELPSKCHIRAGRWSCWMASATETARSFGATSEPTQRWIQRSIPSVSPGSFSNLRRAVGGDTAKKCMWTLGTSEERHP